MTQFLRPTSDISNTGWTASTSTDCFAMIDDTSTDSGADGDYIRSTDTGFILTCSLTTAAVPSSEGHLIHLRAKATGSGGTEKLSVNIRNATTVLFSPFVSQVIERGSFADYTYALTTADIDSLAGNYDALRVAFNATLTSGTESLDVSMFVFEVPDAGATVYDLTVQGTTHAHAADNVVLAAHDVLTVQGSTHAHTADNLELTYNPSAPPVGELEVQGSTHAHNADNVVLASHDTLTVANATHAQTADAPVITLQHALTVDSSTHAQTADAPVLNPHDVLTVSGATHAQSADDVEISAPGMLSIQSSTHAHSVDNVTLVSHDNLTVANAAHAQTADGIILQPHDALTVANAAHAQTAGAVVLEPHLVLTVDGATHAQTADEVAIEYTAEGTLSVQNALHAHAAENVTLSPHFVLTVDDATQTQTADNVTAIYIPPGSATPIPVGHGSVFSRRPVLDLEREAGDYWRNIEDDELLLLFMAAMSKQ